MWFKSSSSVSGDFEMTMVLTEDLPLPYGYAGVFFRYAWARFLCFLLLCNQLRDPQRLYSEERQQHWCDWLGQEYDGWQGEVATGTSPDRPGDGIELRRLRG
jgi:hypothetical protein